MTWQRIAGRPARRGRTAATVAALLLAARLGAVPPDGQPAGGPGDPRYLIETIRIDGARRDAADLIRSTLGLREGAAYAEAALTAAVGRVLALPLVLDAELALEKGSRRGAYTLALGIEEARRWFFGLDLETTFWSRPISVTGTETSSDTSRSVALAGRRFPLGRRGLAFAAVGGQDGSLNVGATFHDLFGRQAVLSASISQAFCSSERRDDTASDQGDEGCRTEIFDLGIDPAFSTWSQTGDSTRLRASVAVPLSGEGQLVIAGTWRRSDQGLRRRAFFVPGSSSQAFRDRQDWLLEAMRVRDTLDDPLFPRSGRRWRLGLEIQGLEAELTLEPAATGPLATARMSSTMIVAGGELVDVRPIGRTGALRARGGLFAGLARVENAPAADGTLVTDDLVAWRAKAGVGYDRHVLGGSADRPWRQLVWETDAEVFSAGTSPAFEQAENPALGFRLRTGLAWRTSWGLFRFAVSYVDVERR